MRLLKSVLLLVTIAFALDGILAFAYAQTTTVVSYTIPAGEKAVTNYKTKTSDSYNPQKYTNTFTNTTLTSPCPKCVIAIEFEAKNGDNTVQAVMMDQTITCNNTALWEPGEYRLQLWRSDPSVLTTHTSGDWVY